MGISHDFCNYTQNLLYMYTYTRKNMKMVLVIFLNFRVGSLFLLFPLLQIIVNFFSRHEAVKKTHNFHVK